uniref:Chalcone/stilbene synthase C-terminal domain-containing protein n=1 Tax=Oryza punctata TaxID=4537 RepID=A0A0E0M5Z7_ORYPU
MVVGPQTMVPGTEHALRMQATGSNIDFYLSIQVPTVLKDNIHQCLLDAFQLVGNTNPNWNDLFWAMHLGGRTILDNIYRGHAPATTREACVEPPRAE